MARTQEEQKELRRQKILNDPITPLLIRMAIPTMVGMMVATIYNLTDTFFIGMLKDTAMTAAIGIVYSFVSFIQALGFWFGYGSGNVMSRLLGQKKDEDAQIYASNGVVMAAVSGIILMVLGLIFLHPLAGFIGGSASEKLLEYTRVYLAIMLIAVPFSLYSTTVYNQMRLCGNAKDAVLGSLSGIVVNIVLDPILIFGFDMGLEGAGIATLIGQIIGCVALTILADRHGNIPVRPLKARFHQWGEDRQNHHPVYPILAGGSPNFSRQGITSLASVLLNIAAAPYGETMLAALTVTTRITALCYLLMIGFGQGFQPICAMNYGAGKYDRVRKALMTTLRVGTVLLVIGTVILLIFAEAFTGVLTKDSEVIAIGARLLRYQCISLPFLGLYAYSGMFFQNIGQYMKALIISVMRQGIVYIPLLYILTLTMGVNGFYILQPASDLISAAVAGVVLYRGVKCTVTDRFVMPSSTRQPERRCSSGQ